MQNRKARAIGFDGKNRAPTRITAVPDRSKQGVARFGQFGHGRSPVAPSRETVQEVEILRPGAAEGQNAGDQNQRQKIFHKDIQPSCRQLPTKGNIENGCEIL